MDNTINKSLGELTFLMKYMKLFSKMQVLTEISKNKVYWELHISRLHAKCLARGCSLYARKCKAKEKRALNKQAVLYHQSANLCTRQLNALKWVRLCILRPHIEHRSQWRQRST
jgi:hypothetical protein